MGSSILASPKRSKAALTFMTFISQAPVLSELLRGDPKVPDSAADHHSWRGSNLQSYNDAGQKLEEWWSFDCDKPIGPLALIIV
jgi:hypothetical protein